MFARACGQRQGKQLKGPQGGCWADRHILYHDHSDGDLPLDICQISLNYMLKIDICKLNLKRADFLSSAKYYCFYF